LFVFIKYKGHMAVSISEEKPGGYSMYEQSELHFSTCPQDRPLHSTPMCFQGFST